MADEGTHEEDWRRHLREGTLALPGLVYLPGYTLDLALASVGPGWSGLVREMFELLQRKAPEARVVQVKEKLARLTVYVYDLPADREPVLRPMITAIEDLSETVCEACGAPGAPQGDPGAWPSSRWLKTLCAKCAHRYYEEGERAWNRIAGWRDSSDPG